RDPERGRQARRLRDEAPPETAPRVETWRQRAAEGRELIPEIPDALLRASARSEAQLAFLREEGLRSGILVPLTARGRTFGALTLLTSGSGRTYGEDDLAWTRQIAERIGLAA